MDNPCIGAQGELRVYRIANLPPGIGATPAPRDNAGAFILAHSEKGHNHVIGGDVDVIEHRDSIGFRTLYALVRAPTSLRQTAANPHGDIALAPGVYEIRVDMEYDPFADQIREVRD